MARNEEKAQSMLNRFLKGKQDEAKGPKAKRPYLATECRDLNEADKWRQQILREVGRKVMQIQNAGLGDHRCRVLRSTPRSSLHLQDMRLAVGPRPPAPAAEEACAVCILCLQPSIALDEGAAAGLLLCGTS